jgi:hypothetical protein
MAEFTGSREGPHNPWGYGPPDEGTAAERIDPHEHIDPDDPRYDGFRIREYWIATAIAPDNQEAPLFVTPQMASDFHLSPGPAMSADERRRLHLRDYAQWIATHYEHEVRIRHFVPEGEPELITPGTGAAA